METCYADSQSPAEAVPDPIRITRDEGGDSALHPWQALPCNEFIAWADSRFRRRLIASLGRLYIFRSGGDVDQAYQGALLFFWRRATTGREYDSEVHVYNAMLSHMIRESRYVRVANARAGAFQVRSEYIYQMLFSQLEQEYLDDVVARASCAATPAPDLGWSKPGWFSRCMEALTGEERQAVELTLVGDIPGEVAADIMGVTCRRVRNLRSQSLRKLRRRISAGKLEIAQPIDARCA